MRAALGMVMMMCAVWAAACTGLVEGAADPTEDKLSASDGSVVPRGDANTFQAPDASVVADSAPAAWIPETICQPWATPQNNKDQSVVPLEVLPKNASAKKIVLVAGAPGHGAGQHEFFAGNALLAKLLCRIPGVVPVLVKNSWPQNQQVFAGAAAIVMYLDGGENHPLTSAAHRAVLAPEIARGAGFVNLHYAVEYPASMSDAIMPWIGGRYDSGFSHNPYWTPAMAPYPSHAIARGVGPLVTEDEWYYDLRFAGAAVTPILVGSGANQPSPSTGNAQTLGWAFDRPDGGRSFGFTGGHFHGNWSEGKDHDAAQRRLVINAILWSAGIDVPPAGADVTLDDAWRWSWMDTK